MAKEYILIFIFLSFICSSAFAHHDEEGQWEPLSAGPLTTWTAPLCGKGKLVAQPFFFYNRTRGTFDAEGNSGSLSGDERKYQFQEQLFVQYGLTNQIEVDAQALYQENFVKQGDRKAHSRGFGDSNLFLRYCILEEEGWIPHATGILQLKFPTGKYQKADPDKLGTDLMGAASGAGSYDYGFGINLSKKIKPFVLHGDAIYSFPQERKIDAVKTEYGRYLNYDLGLEYFLPKRFNLMAELNGFLQGDKSHDGQKLPATDIYSLSFAAGGGWSNDKVQALLAYQRMLIGTNTDVVDSVVVTFVYTF